MIEREFDEAAGLTHDWMRWLAKNKMLGLPDSRLVEVIADAGVPESAAWAEIARLGEDPGFQAGCWIAERLHKLESLLAIQEQLRDLRPSARKIEYRRDISPGEFFTRYYAENWPVVLLDFAYGWPACGWTVASLASALGDEPVEVMVGRERDEHYELNTELHRSTMPFSEYVERVRAAERSNDTYLVANNRLLDTRAAAPLWQDFDAGRPPLDGADAPGHVFLWFGPGGTVTPMHHDLMNVLFVQIYGRKQFTLVAPGFTPRVYNEVGVHADVDPDLPDYYVFPAFRGVPTTTVTLEPGDTLFLPVGWWHRVESLDASISLSFTNFAENNEFHWRNPTG
jgi:hypothetical protein